MPQTKPEVRSRGLMAFLREFCGIEWRKIRADFQSLDGGISFRAIELPHSAAFQFRDDLSGTTAYSRQAS